MKPKVWNKRDRAVPAGSVYVGRPTKWGNPFSHMRGTLAKHQVANREEAITAYRNWLLNTEAGKELQTFLPELKGKHLVCWCAPAKCHADILLELANKEI